MNNRLLRLKKIVEDDDTRAGKCFDIGVQILIVITLITFSIETLPALSPTAKRVLRITEIATVAIFTIEYLLRLYFADDRWKFATSFVGIIDLLAIIPFYITSGFDLRSMRAFRLLRLFRIFKLARYSVAATRFHRAFLMIREELVLFFCVTAILLFLGAVGIYHFERDAQPKEFASIFHSLWWAVATLTTVGYGDVYPVTVGGRVFTFFLLLIGLGIVAVPAGLIATALQQARAVEKEEQETQQ